MFHEVNEKTQMLKFLGRGGAFNVKEGNTAAYLKKGDTLLLIDCGETTFGDMMRINLLHDVLDAHVLITHVHGDHIGSLSTFIYYCFYVRGFKPVVYYNDEDHRKDISMLLKLMGCDESFYKLQTMDDQGECASKVSLRKIFPYHHIESIKVSHYPNMNSYAFRFCCMEGYQDVFYSGDINDIKIIEKYVLEFRCHQAYIDTTLLDYEGNVHLSLRELDELFPQERRKSVWCMHVNLDECIEQARALGFNVVEVEKEVFR